MIRIGICAIHRCTRQAAQAKSFLGGHAVTRKEPTVFFREKNIEPKQLLKRKKKKVANCWALVSENFG
jgi:hypothetical protein